MAAAVRLARYSGVTRRHTGSDLRFHLSRCADAADAGVPTQRRLIHRYPASPRLSAANPTSAGSSPPGELTQIADLRPCGERSADPPRTPQALYGRRGYTHRARESGIQPDRMLLRPSSQPILDTFYGTEPYAATPFCTSTYRTTSPKPVTGTIIEGRPSRRSARRLRRLGRGRRQALRQPTGVQRLGGEPRPGRNCRT